MALALLAVCLVASASLRALLANQRHLILLNLWRLVGAVFLILMANGQMPTLWALPAGIGDILVGAMAPWIAGRVYTAAGQRRAILFNMFGMADLVVAVGLGIMHKSWSRPAVSHNADVRAGDTLSTRVGADFSRAARIRSPCDFRVAAARWAVGASSCRFTCSEPMTSVLIIAVAAPLLVWVLSHVVEALRRAPKAPDAMPWAPDLKPAYVIVEGARLRYVTVGTGPVLVLLHTLRTQLDLFHKVVPELARDHTVYALDLPGHGYSDIPAGSYDADFFVRHVEGFLDVLDLNGVTLAGVSIGANIALIIAARRNRRVVRIIPINPYDYDSGKGMARASLLTRVVIHLTAVPVVGEIVMRLRNYFIVRSALLGGVSAPDVIAPSLMRELYRVGNRRRHYRGFVTLLRRSASWEQARSEYDRIAVPTLLIWGADDWAYSPERRYDESLIRGVRAVTVEGGGHFLPLDRPGEVVDLIRSGT
jgi:pimeloyl-ACP methyl ester carboxylesterase